MTHASKNRLHCSLESGLLSDERWWQETTHRYNSLSVFSLSWVNANSNSQEREKKHTTHSKLEFHQLRDRNLCRRLSSASSVTATSLWEAAAVLLLAPAAGGERLRARQFPFRAVIQPITLILPWQQLSLRSLFKMYFPKDKLNLG